MLFFIGFMAMLISFTIMIELGNAIPFIIVFYTIVALLGNDKKGS